MTWGSATLSEWSFPSLIQCSLTFVFLLPWPCFWMKQNDVLRKELSAFGLNHSTWAGRKEGASGSLVKATLQNCFFNTTTVTVWAWLPSDYFFPIRILATDKFHWTRKFFFCLAKKFYILSTESALDLQCTAKQYRILLKNSCCIMVGGVFIVKGPFASRRKLALCT